MSVIQRLSTIKKVYKDTVHEMLLYPVLSINSLFFFNVDQTMVLVFNVDRTTAFVLDDQSIYFRL